MLLSSWTIASTSRTIKLILVAYSVLNPELMVWGFIYSSYGMGSLHIWRAAGKRCHVNVNVLNNNKKGYFTTVDMLSFDYSHKNATYTFWQWYHLVFIHFTHCPNFFGTVVLYSAKLFLNEICDKTHRSTWELISQHLSKLPLRRSAECCNKRLWNLHTFLEFVLEAFDTVK